MRGLVRRVEAAAPERRSRGGWARGGVAGAGIVTAALIAGLAAVGAVGNPLSYVSGVAGHVSGEGTQKQTSLQLVALDAATAQYAVTSITTALSEPRIDTGQAVHDEAMLSGETENAGGTVTYTYFTNSTCSAGGQSAGTVKVSKGRVMNSNSIVFYTPGTFYWQAVYSGDANNSGSTSTCGSEILTVMNP